MTKKTGLTFCKGSIAKTQNYVRTKLNQNELGAIHSDHELYKILFELLQKHPRKKQKIGCGLSHFDLRQNCGTKGSEVHVIRIDNTSDDFSWRKCISGNFNEQKHDLESAMRNAIYTFTSGFKNDTLCIGSSLCGICKKVLDTQSEIHVDHEDPLFHTLMKNFLRKTNMKSPTKFESESILNNKKFRKEDQHFEKEWVSYHNSHAKLRLLCSHCNLSRPKTEEQ